MFLQNIYLPHKIELDLPGEIKRAEEDLKVFLA